MNKKFAAILIIALVVSVVGVALFAGGTFESARGPVSVDTDAYAYRRALALGDMCPKGSFPDLDGDERHNGEVFTTTTIWYSWFQDGESQEITTSGTVEPCPGNWITASGLWDAWRFEFQVDVGDGLETFYQDDVPEGLLEHKGSFGFAGGGTVAFHIDGYTFCTVKIPNGGDCPDANEKTIVDGSKLRVDVYLMKNGNKEHHILRDEVRLKNAVPSFKFSRDAYVVGETATAEYIIPVVEDESYRSLYFLEITDCNKNEPLPGFERRALTLLRGSFSFVVGEEFFSNDISTCKNRLRGEIFTTLIIAAQADASVQGTATLGAGEPPVVEEVTSDKAEYDEGDTIRVSWEATGKISKYHVTAQIGGLYVFDSDISNTTTVSFRAPSAGVLQVEVTAYNDCQPSAVKRVLITIGNKSPGMCQQYPDLPQCQAGQWRLILAVVACVLGFLAALTAYVLFKGNAYVRVVVSVLVGIITAVLVYVIGEAIGSALEVFL